MLVTVQQTCSRTCHKISYLETLFIYTLTVVIKFQIADIPGLVRILATTRDVARHLCMSCDIFNTRLYTWPVSSVFVVDC